MTQDENYPTKFTAKANLVPGELKFTTNRFGLCPNFFFRGKDDYTAVLGGNGNKWNITGGPEPIALRLMLPSKAGQNNEASKEYPSRYLYC